MMKMFLNFLGKKQAASEMTQAKPVVTVESHFADGSFWVLEGLVEVDVCEVQRRLISTLTSNTGIQSKYDSIWSCTGYISHGPLTVS